MEVGREGTSGWYYALVASLVPIIEGEAGERWQERFITPLCRVYDGAECGASVSKVCNPSLRVRLEEGGRGGTAAVLGLLLRSVREGAA